MLYSDLFNVISDTSVNIGLDKKKGQFLLNEIWSI